MADKKISELDLALQINNDAVFPMSQDNAGEPTTFKAGITQLGTEIAEDMTFSNLQTTSKKLVGAINELLSLGNPIILGTSAPTSSQGANGNLYIQYTAGTGGADDEVDGIYVKLDGAWCEISTGGGSGTTDYEDLSNKPQVNSVELVGNKTLDDLGIMPASLSKTVSGAIAHFTDGADNVPVKSLVSQIVAVESGSGEKSPTNPYSISGFDSGVIAVTSENVFDMDSWLTSINENHTVSGNVITISYITLKVFDNPCVISNTDKPFFISVNEISGTATGARLQLLDSSNNVVAQVTNANRTASGTGCKIRIDYGNGGSAIFNNLIVSEHYNTYTFAFGQTVYGGHFDNKGNLVVTHGFVEITGSEGLYLDIAPNVVALSGIPIPISQVDTSLLEPMSNIATYSTQGTGNFNNNEYGLRTTGIVYYKNTSCTTLNDFKTFFGNNHLQICYKLANPITLAITSQDIPTLLGENNIFSNTGDVEVNYYTDNADEIVEVAKATASNGVKAKRYQRTLTSSQYGWFDFVDENGNLLDVTKYVPISATAYSSGSYYVGQIFYYATSNKYMFKIIDINISSGSSYAPVGSSLSNLTFDMAYIECDTV